MKKQKTIFGLAILAAILMLGIGYAAVSNITLNINGSASATADSDYEVIFTEEEGDITVVQTAAPDATVTPDVDDEDATKATLDVSGLTTKGEKVEVTYTIANNSADLSASITATTSNNNTEYFTVTSSINTTPVVVAKDDSTTVTVTVELIKTPIDADQTATIGVELTAEPVQPVASSQPAA